MKKRLKVLDLFSGIGGFSLGLHKAGMETVGFCEIDEFCQKVLNKNFPEVPVFSDIKKITKEEIDELGRIDIVCGGFPCQPFSNAGKKKGREDDRDLWPEMFRVIKETKPAWVIGENVAGFIGMEFTRTKVNLESIGYSVQPFIIPACAVGAQHRRDRVWIIAHLDGERMERHRGTFRNEPQHSDLCSNDPQEPSSDIDSSELWQQPGRRRGPSGENSGVSGNDGKKGLATNFDSDGLSRKTNASTKKNNKREWENNWWTEATFNFGNWGGDQSAMGRAVYGFSDRVDKYRRQRVKALGNAVVPQIPEIIGRFIMEIN